MMLRANLVIFASFALGVGAKQIWSNEPADQDNIILTAYPLGNGKLGGKGFQLASLSKSSSEYGH
jgi:alpha-L-fucosidase 2